MLTLPDFKEKKILLINADYNQHNLLQLNNSNIRFLRNNELVNQVSCHLVFAIFIVGEMTITTTLLKKLSSLGISVFFLNQNLSTKASVPSNADGNFLLRKSQYDSFNSFTLAKKIVTNKIENQEEILKKSKVAYDKKVFEQARAKLREVKNNQELLGTEGRVSKEYFQSLFKKEGWIRRAPQTKEDIYNLLLDIGYSYLFNYCEAILRLFGFDVYKGFYHQLFFQRKSLVCDVMEPMRPLIDYQLLKAVHLKQIRENDFIFKQGEFEFKEGFKGSKKYSGIFLEAINEHKETIYRFIVDFYHYYMNSNKYQFPNFKL